MNLQGPGIYHGTLNFESTSEDFIDTAQLLPYPSFATGVDGPETPQSIALTEFHFILLYKDRIAAVCNLNEKLAYEEMLPLVTTFSLFQGQH
jgi:vacuolar protein sorting-associated protein 18